MLSTQEVVDALRRVNPGGVITEDRIRHAIRRRLVTPRSFAGRLAWSTADVAALAVALDLVPPPRDDEPGCVTVA